MPDSPLVSAAVSVFERLGGDIVDPPSLIGADVPLDLSGEAVRSRLCVFSDHRGREIALRPDLTLPIAIQEAAARADGIVGERVRRYAARAFRLPAAKGFDTEFTQVGFERFGAPRSVETDVNAFEIVLEAARAGPAAPETAWLGDLALFPAIVERVVGPGAAADGVKRRFRQGGKLSLSDDTPANASVGASLARTLSKSNRSDAEALVGDILAMAGVDLVGSRGLDEIVDRLMSNAATEADSVLTDTSRALLQEVLSLNGPAKKTASTLQKRLAKDGIDGLDDHLQTLTVRLDALEAAASGVSLRFAAGFGRRFNYYDGFLFEVFAAGAHPMAPLAAGGRYDSLIGALSDGKANATAIGGVVRPDRMSITPSGTRERAPKQ